MPKAGAAGVAEAPEGDIGRDELLLRLRALRPEFEALGVTRMTLFGSRARGDNRPDSDIDLMIEVGEQSRFSLLDLVWIGHIVEDRVGRPTGVSMRTSMDPRFRDDILDEEVRVF